MSSESLGNTSIETDYGFIKAPDSRRVMERVGGRPPLA